MIKRPVRLDSQQGLLLVEAALSAVIIATGLIFISRGLGGQLNALRTVEEYDTVLALARGKLLELEGQRLAGHVVPTEPSSGTFDDPYQFYQWTMAANVRDDLQDDNHNTVAKEVILTVRKNGPVTTTHGSSVQLCVIWPKAWVPDAWPSKIQ